MLKQGIGCNFDQLTNLANNHHLLRSMLGHGPAVNGEVPYRLSTVIRNVGFITPDLLAEVNALVVKAGHAVAGHEDDAALKGRCDSFVVETNVHFPTDISLLHDATRCTIRTVRKACENHGLAGWRQHDCLTRRVRSKFQKVNKSRLWNSRPAAVRSYIGYCGGIAERAGHTLAELDADTAEATQLRDFLVHTHRQIDQVDRRLLRDETIPHEEKVFSIFEGHTRWICKGKAGRPVELGVPVCVVEDQHQFILGHRIMWRGGNTEAAVSVIEACRRAHPQLRACSFDRGFHSPENRRRLAELLDTVTMPKKGRLTTADRVLQAEPEFVRARRQHPAIESAINKLEHHGLDRVRTRGAEGFERTVALSILSANLHRLGTLLLGRQRKRRTRLRLAA